MIPNYQHLQILACRHLSVNKRAPIWKNMSSVYVGSTARARLNLKNWLLTVVLSMLFPFSIKSRSNKIYKTRIKIQNFWETVLVSFLINLNSFWGDNDCLRKWTIHKLNCINRELKYILNSNSTIIWSHILKTHKWIYFYMTEIHFLISNFLKNSKFNFWWIIFLSEIYHWTAWQFLNFDSYSLT